jgi:nitroimidazol reductase NimA-like FMN-containing flavoprotein (pyridoxamine 5'-phosphate oxidase superfamily)
MAKNYSLETTPANESRRSEYARDDAWIRAFLHQAEIGHVATRWDDQPFITPTTFWYDEAQNEIIFHSNIVGRVRANIERHPRVCFEVSEAGRFLASDIALEFSVQYASVIAFGKARIITDKEEKKRGLYGLIDKYFPDKRPGENYRPITDGELARTSVYAISIESWSGKENWPERAEQSNETTSIQGATR